MLDITKYFQYFYIFIVACLYDNITFNFLFLLFKFMVLSYFFSINMNTYMNTE